MADGDTLYRPGPADSRQLAALYRLAAGGVADYLWSDLAEDGEDILDAGARRFARPGEDVSFENCIAAASIGAGGDEDQDDGVMAGMVLAFPMREMTDLPPDFDPVLRPYAELEQVPSLYICGIAVHSAYQGRGIGRKLLDAAGAHYANAGLPAHSLIAFEENTGAVRLYERLGYEIVGRRAVVPHPFIQYAGDALLMVRAI